MLFLKYFLKDKILFRAALGTWHLAVPNRHGRTNAYSESLYADVSISFKSADLTAT